MNTSHSYGPKQIEVLYHKYHDELVELGERLQEKYFQMMRQYQGMATFGDGEGEVLYMLIREEQPEVVFEISPCSGWSTNYSLAALTRNGHGTLHSFEIMKTFFGKPTEQAIRDNVHSSCNQSQLVVHIGDARELAPTVLGTINFVLIDSLHTAEFAQWYTSEIFPRVKGTIFIQDIAFHDLLEHSSEATFLWKWLRESKIDFALVNEAEDHIRKTSEIRADIPERRGLRSNSLILQHPYAQASAPKELALGSDELIGKAAKAFREHNPQEARTLITMAIADAKNDVTKVNRHRVFMKAAELLRKIQHAQESARCAQWALAIALQGDLQQQKKSLSELWFLYARQKRIGKLFHVSCLLLVFPQAWKVWIDVLKGYLKLPNSRP